MLARPRIAVLVVLAFMGLAFGFVGSGCSKKQPDLTAEQKAGLQVLGEMSDPNSKTSLMMRIRKVGVDSWDLNPEPKRRDLWEALMAFHSELDRREKQDAKACAEWAEGIMKGVTADSFLAAYKREGWKKD